MDSKKFINPYNFISFPKEKAKAYEDVDSLSGVIRYTVTPLTPIFVPNSSSNTAFSVSNRVNAHVSYDFFSYTNLDKKETYETKCFEPVLPGSELRGVFRSVYETLTDSCMSCLDEETIPSRRYSGFFKPGLIKKIKENTYELWKADSYSYRDGSSSSFQTNEYSEGGKVYINIRAANGREKGLSKADCSKSREGLKQTEGYFIKGMDDGSICRKKHAHIFVGSFKLVDLYETDIDSLKQCIKEYQTQSGKEDSYKDYEKELNSFLKSPDGRCFPVYYSQVPEYSKTTEKTLVFLSPACITREVYKVKIKDLAADFVPCKGDGICPTCALFGRVDTDKTIASKIRFSDARIIHPVSDCKEYYWRSGAPVTLQSLGTPKISNTAFYLKKPFDSKFWTYEYFVDASGKTHIAKAELRGRKYYWHHQNPSFPDVEPTNLNKTARLLDSKESNRFSGEVYFDGISQKQLNQLLWILNGGSRKEDDWNIAYKIGGGKPLGLGSVKCHVTDYTIRSFSYDEETHRLEYKEESFAPLIDTYDAVGFSSSIKAEFKMMFGFESIPANVRITYPITEDQSTKAQRGEALENGYQWFEQNKKKDMYGKAKNASSRADLIFAEGLPMIDSNVSKMLLSVFPDPNKKDINRSMQGRNTYVDKRNSTERREHNAKQKQWANGYKSSAIKGAVQQNSPKFVRETLYEARVIECCGENSEKRMRLSVAGVEEEIRLKDWFRDVNKPENQFHKGEIIVIKCKNYDMLSKKARFEFVERKDK